MNKKVVRKLKRAIVKEEYVAITGDILEAIILNQMIYWSERVNDFDKFIAEERERQNDGSNISDIPLLCGWIHKSAGELKDEVMSADSQKTILRKLENLVKKGFLMRRRNPDHPYDHVYQYRVDFMAVLDALECEGYTLEGYRVEFDCNANNGDSNDADNQPTIEISDRPKSENKNKNVKTKGQIVPTDSHNVTFKSKNVLSESHSVPAIPETTTEITSEITLSSSYSPKGGKRQARTEDMTGKVSKFLDVLGLEQIAHREMAEPIRAILSNLLSTGKVGRNKFQREDIKKALQNLTVNDIDSVIDRFAMQAKKENIPCPDEYLKVSLLKAGRASQLRSLAGKSGSDGIHCGKPSYDIDEFIRLSMDQLHQEK